VIFSYFIAFCLLWRTFMQALGHFKSLVGGSLCQQPVANRCCAAAVSRAMTERLCIFDTALFSEPKRVETNAAATVKFATTWY
jgi:hypothetical protein